MSKPAKSKVYRNDQGVVTRVEVTLTHDFASELDPEKHDVPASIAKYTVAVIEKLQARYPDAKITVKSPYPVTVSLTPKQGDNTET